MRLLVAIAVLATLASADDSAGVCARSCVLGGTDAMYEAGMQYHYQYQGEVKSTAVVAGQDESRLAFSAEVVITANTPCDLKLMVANLVVESISDDAKWFSEAVQEHDLHFSYQHGTITHLCPHVEEEAVATNFKRGILSALQMSVSTKNHNDVVVSEVDVLGECDTKYSVVLEPSLEVTKTKMGCHISSYIPHLPHSQYTNIKANAQLPFVKSNQVCKMQGSGGRMVRGDIDAIGGEGGAWQKVECRDEVEVRRPLMPGGDALASVTVSSMLTLDQGPSPMDGTFSKDDKSKKRVSLVANLKAAVEFAEKKKIQASGMREQLDSVLGSMSTSESPDGEDTRPRLFSSLVHLLGYLEEEELEALWDASRTQRIHRKVLMDGLLVCDAGPCHGLVAQLAGEEGVLSPSQVNSWLTGLHLHSSSHPPVITQLLNLAKSQKQATVAAVMAASSMVHRLCQQQPAECPSLAQPFLEYVEQNVGDSCGLGKSKQQQEHVKLVLRAMGNAGVLPTDHFPERCYLNKALSPELRITALQSYRRSGCTDTKGPWQLLEDESERSEVRIAAYLALVPCIGHTSSFSNYIHNFLQHEKVHQVYSFIWTHVKNLADHPGPSSYDQTLSKLFRQYTLPRRFNSDAFRSSGNFRYDQFSEMLNLGGSLDANVVYSKDSYMPRQVSANLTLDVLDNSFNFLDFGVEFSGIENIIESFFGKDGYFGNEDVLKVLQSLRPKRNLIHDDKIQEFQKIYDEAKDKKLATDDMGEEEAKASFYVRMFGNEVLYVENFLQYSSAQLLYHLIQEISSPKTFKVIDQEYMTPTLLGFPLRLRLNATASVSLQHQHTFQNTQMSGLLLEGSIVPTLVAAVDETLLVDAFVSSSGFRRSSTQVAKTSIGGKFSYQDGEVTELHVSVPSEEVTMVSSSVKVALLKDAGRWEEPKGISTEEKDHCINAIEEMVGLKMCASHRYSTYEVAGELVSVEPYETEFKVAKTDSFTYYKLYIKWQDNIVEALFDTPGSSVDRKIHFLFHMNPDHESGYVVVRGVGYGIKGQFSNSETTQELQLQYLQASEVLGELEVSLNRHGNSSQEYVPKFQLAIGSNKFTLEGKFKHNTNEDAEKVEVSWELEGMWHKKQSDMVMQAFGAVSGSFTAGPDGFNLQLSTEYGNDPSQPHTITLNLGGTHSLHRDMQITSGYASLQISQVPIGLIVEYELRPDLFELSINTSLQDTQVSSQVVLKNMMEGGSWDTQLTLSLSSQQLNLDYKVSGIYRVSESGFQAEVELNLGASLKSKFLLTYLFEDDPMHVLAGLNLIFNDFVFQIVHSIDMSQPDHLLITISSIVGEGTAGLHLEADYGAERPLNILLELYAGLGIHSISFAFNTTSDPLWHTFTGMSTIKWLGWSGSLAHEITFNETTRAFKFSLGTSKSVEFYSETSPNQTVKVVVKDGLVDSIPIFLMEAERHITSDRSRLQVNLTAGGSQLMYLAWHMDSENKFTLEVHILESELSMKGQYDVIDNGTVSGASQVKIMLPTGDTVSSNLSLSYIMAENERLLSMLASHEGSVIEAQLLVNLCSHDTERAGVNFTLTTPHPDLQKFGLNFHKSGGAHSLYSAGIQLDNFKILGEAQLSDPSNLTVKLEYEGGEECATRLHLEHRHSERQYFSLASLAPTQASEPWELILNISHDHSKHRKFLDTMFNVHAPVVPAPFHFHGKYDVTLDQVQLEIQAGLEESISVLYSGKKELSWKRHLLHGLGKIEASWMEPLAINVTYDHTLGRISIYADFQSAEEYMSPWSTEFSSEYSSLEDIKASFYLTHPEFQVTMELVHNQSKNSWKQQLDGSINTFTITYNTNLRWNEYLVPIEAEGSLSLFNFLDHSLDLSLSHLEDSSTYKTQVTGTFDDYSIGLEHQLGLIQAEGSWQGSLQISLRDIGATTGGIILTTNTLVDWPAINASLKFESPWTDSFSVTFLVQEMNTTTSFKLDSLYSDKSVLSVHIMCGRWPSWDYSDIDLQVKSVFEDFNMKLQHDFNSGNLIIGKMSYGSDVDVQFGSHLKIKETWFEQEFLSYAFNVSASLTQLNINLKGIATVDSHLNGTLELHWNEDSLSVNSSLLSGKIFEAKLRNSGTNYQSGLKYEFGGNILFSINFTLLRDGESLVHFSIVVGSIHPKLHATSTLELYYNTDSKSQSTVLVTADLTNIDKYSLQGSLQLKSNLLASKEYGGQLDFDMNFHDELGWKCAVGIAVLGGEWDIKSGINSSLEVNQVLNFEFGARLHILYGNVPFDLKDVNVVLTAESDTAYEMRMILQPSHTGTPWSLAIIYNPRFRTLKGFLSLGDPSKYELSLRLSTKTLTVDVHLVNEDDSKWQIVEGNINWIIKRTKQLVTINMKSDIAFISKITGKIIVQKKRDVAVTATLKVNDDQFLGNFRLSTPEPGKSFRLDIKIDNSIVQVFESEVTLEFFYIQSGFTYTVKVGLNQESDWIEGNLKFSVPESYIKLKTPFSFLETFNATVRMEISEDYGIEIVIETPQFCSNLTGNMDRNFLYASLNLSLDIPCNGNSMVDFKIQYTIGRSPAAVILCELNIFEYRPLFKFNATGILTLEEAILRIETEAYPQHTFGLSLAWQVGEQYNLMLLVDDPTSNETYFTFEILLSPLKAELTIRLPEEQFFLLKANYDFKNQSLRFRSNFTSSLFNYELNAEMAAEATLGEEGNIEIIFTSNTAFTHLNISTVYSFLEELKDISFKILTPSGDADVEIRVLKDKDFYTIKADMTSSIHSFHKYHLEVRQTVEDNMEKLIAMLSQDDIEYHMSGSKKITENGTEGSLNVSLPFENYEHFSLDYIQQGGFPEERQQVKLNVKSHDTMYIVEARHNPVNALYELLLNRTASGNEYVCTIRYSADSSGCQIEIVLNIPELEERFISVLLKYNPEGLGSAVFYSPYGQLGAESSWTVAANNVAVSGTAYLSLFDLGEYNLDMNIPLQLSERAEIKIMCIYPDQKIDMWLSAAQYFKTMGGSLLVRKGELEKAYSLTYDLRETVKLEGKFDKWSLETTWILKGTQAPASSGHFQVRSNLPGYEIIDGSWEVGHKNWEYFGQATLDMKHQEVLSVSATLDTLSEAAYQPWQSVRLNMLLESPFTLPHHLHAEYQLLAPRLLLYYQHGLDTFKMQLISNFESNAATLTLTGNVPVNGVSTFEINFAYNFLESYIASVVVRVEDSTLEHKFDFSSDWRVGSLQTVLTSPFLKPGKAHLSWSLVPNSVNLKGFFSVGELSAKVKMSLENTKSSADFDCHITTSMEELSQFIVSLSYRVSGNRNFDASFAAMVNNNGLLMKSSFDTKGKLLLKFQGTFEILENRGSLEVDVGTTWNGYIGTVVGKFPGYKKFSVDLYCDSCLLKLNCLYDSEEVFIVSITCSQIKVLLYWTEYWSFNLETQHQSKGGKLLFHLIFSGFGGDPIEIEASYSQRPNPQVELSLATSLLQPSTLHVTYSSNKVTARATVGDKIYLMTGQATFGKLQSSFDIHFRSSDEPNDSIVVQAEYDFTDFFRGKMKTAKELAQITLVWRGKTQVNVTGLLSGFTAMIDLKMETPLESLPHLHLGFHGEFFFIESFGFNCTAFAEWSERLELTAIAKLTQATVNVESILTTSFPSLERLSAFAKLEPGQLQFIAQYNADTWKAVWAYQFTPFSVTCTLETPIKNFEKILLSFSLNADNGKVGAQFELMWTEDQSVGVQIEVEKWQVDVNLQTPWEPFTSGLFTALLKTESEELTFSSALQLNKQEAEVSFIILSTDFKFLASYREDSVTVGLAKLEHLQRDDSIRISLEVQTPCKNLEVLEMSLQYGNNKFSLMFEINEVMSIIEGMYSASGGDFKVTVPLLSNLTWSLKSENSWLKAETSVIFNVAETSEPQMASFNYNIGPSFSTFRSMLKVVNHKYLLSVDVKYDHGISFMARFMKYSLALEVDLLGERNSIKIKIEAPDLGLESLEVDGALEGDYDPYRLDTNLIVLVKHQGEKPHMYKIEGAFAIEEYHLSAVGKIGSNGLPTYEISIKIPLNFLGLEIMLTGGRTELFALQYSSGSQHDWFLPQKFVIQAPAWEAEGHLLLTLTSLTASLTLPQPLREHSLTVKWPKQFTFQDLQISAELKSPYIHQDDIQITFTCKVPENFTGKVELSIVFGDENMHVNGEYYYDDEGKTFNAKFQVTSNWISNYFLTASVQWRSGILVSASLEALDEEHSVRLHIDVANSAIELKLKSTHLPAKEITFTGKISNPLDLSHLTLTSKLQADDQNVHLEAKVDNDQMKDVNVFVVLKQNNQDIFYLSLEMYEDLTRTDIDLSVHLLLEELKNSIRVRYYNSDWGRYFSGNLDSYMLTEQVQLTVINSHELRSLQSLKFSGPDFRFHVESHVSEGESIINTKLGYEEIFLYISGDISGEKPFGIRMETTFVSCEVLSLYAKWSDPDRREAGVEYAWNGDTIKLYGNILADDIFVYSVHAMLITTFEGYEKFSVYTPRHKSGKYSKALLEYPGRKVGVDINLDFQNIFLSDFTISLYLPYEQFEIVSVKYIVQSLKHFELEARIGKIGLTLSSFSEPLSSGMIVETIVRVNEQSGKSVLYLAHARTKRMLARYSFVFEPKELTEHHSFHLKGFYEVNDRVFFMAKTNMNELVKVHLAWGADKIFTLITPKFLPSYIHTNFECSSLRNDYHIEFGHLAYSGIWSVFGLQLHQEVLPGGHHLSLLGRSGKHLVSVAGTLSATPYHFNNSLVFILNKNKLGYKMLLLSEPGILSRSYTSDVQLLLYNRTLHYYTRAEATVTSLHLISDFTWNKMDIHMPSITFSVNYDDRFIFGKGKKYLRAVLSHPDIKDITLQANITCTHNSSLSGSAELIDGNSPDMKIVATVEVEPVNEDGRKTVSLSLSQPVSSFSMLVEGQLRQSPFNEALCHLKYYSLTSETWHQLNVSASLEAEGSSHILTVAAVAPERKWGHTWMGVLDFGSEVTSLSVEGSSQGPGDTWRLGTLIKRHLPELHAYLSVGKEQEVYEEARVRLGLHSPVEAGAALDHLRFGQWHQDAALGLRLASPHILQAFVEFNPSMNYEDSYEWAQLFSSAAEVLDVWGRDMAAAKQTLEQLATAEVPAAVGVLLSNGTIQAIWQREASNWEYFLKDVEDSYLGIAEDIRALWESVLVPIFNHVKDHTFRMYEEALNYLATLKDSIQHHLEGILQWLQQAWHSLKTKSALQEGALRMWLAEGLVVLDQGASVFWIDLLRWITGFSEKLKTSVTSLLEGAEGYFISLGEMVEGYLSNTFQAIQPRYEQLLQTLESYRNEVLAEFSGPCWMAIADKKNNLAVLSQNLDDSARVVIEFLQGEKLYALLLQASDWMKEKTLTVWSSIEETMTKAGQNLPQVLNSWSPSLSETISQAWDTLSDLSTQVFAEGLYSSVASMTGDLREKVAHVVSQLSVLLRENTERVHSYLVQFSAFGYVDVAMRGIYHWAQSAWQSWSLGKHTDLDFLEQTLFLGANAVRNYLVSTNYLLDHIYVFEPGTLGHILYNQYLPIHWASFMELPHWAFPFHLFQTELAATEAERLLAAALPNPSLEQAITPSYTATAIIAGQHVTTFDLQHYQFLGSCTYLLAKDFEGGDFEAFGVYEVEAGATRLKTVVVHGPNIDVALNVDGNVTARGTSAKIYYNSTEYSALKLPDLFVSCSRALRGCALTVSAKYFGRLGGLLGNYNGEASDDLHGPGGQMVQDVAQLATLWAISPTPCYQANQASIVEYSDVEEEDVRECSQLFLYRSSLLSSCFHAIDPHPYFTHCIQGTTHPAFSEHDLNSPCTAVSSYHTQCWARDIHLPYLDKCQNGSSTGCVVEGREVPYGWSQVYEETSHGSADVAIIVELADCNAGKKMNALLEHLSRQLERKNINDAHYSVVTVGEDRTTIRSFLNKTDAEDFLNTLTFSGSRVMDGIETAVTSTASQIQWRPGVSRSIVHVGCQVCENGDEATKVLHQNDVTYHLVSSLRVEMAGTKEEAQARTRKMFGFDKNLVYTPADFKNFRGNEKLRLALRGPKGGCVATALSTGGSVFESDKWTPRKEIQARKFLSVLGERIAVSSSPPKCQECHCLKGNQLTWPTCYKCFGNSAFLITQVDSVAEDSMADTSSVTKDIKRSFQVFLETNRNSTNMRIL